MIESIFSIAFTAILFYIMGLFIYLFCIRFSNRGIYKHIEESREYEEYLESHCCKPYLYALIDYRKKISNKEISDDEISQMENQFVQKELNLCNEFINYHPKNLYSREKRAELYIFLKDYKNAINDYRYLIKKMPKKFEYVKGCADAYAHLNNINFAFQLINYFYKNKKLDSEYYNALGSVFNISKDYQSSIKNYSEAIKIKPHWSYYLSRGKVYQKIGKLDEYIADNNQYEKLYNASGGDINYYIDENQETGSKQKPFYKKFITYKILLTLLAIFAISYFHPTKETMYRSQNHVCKVERTYFGIYKANTKIKLNSLSNLSCHTGAYARGRHHTDYGLYLRLDGVAPFVFYVADSSLRSYEFQMDELGRHCESYQENFSEYLKGNNEHFAIRSKAGAGKLVFCIIMIIIMLFVIFAEDISRIINKNNDKSNVSN